VCQRRADARLRSHQHPASCGCAPTGRIVLGFLALRQSRWCAIDSNRRLSCPEIPPPNRARTATARMSWPLQRRRHRAIGAARGAARCGIRIGSAPIRAIHAQSRTRASGDVDDGRTHGKIRVRQVIVAPRGPAHAWVCRSRACGAQAHHDCPARDQNGEGHRAASRAENSIAISTRTGRGLCCPKLLQVYSSFGSSPSSPAISSAA